jgi:enamine deaminase RidA (YjgF/YER057c/UK114 family)
MAQVVNPRTLADPKGYSNGMLMDPGRVLFVAGQVGWDASSKMVEGGLTAQFAQALDNIVDVVREAGGAPEHIGRLTIYVIDKGVYEREAKSIGVEYRKRMGKHFPAMALVQVAALLEEGAMVEIEATAVIPATG